MTTVYRLVKARHARDAVSGEGALLYGGRWNPPGYPVVYAAESRALAVLETFVHLTMEARDMRFMLYEITLPKEVKPRTVERSTRSGRSLQATQEVGRTWLSEGKSLILVAPSIIAPREANVVINVQHPQFSRVQVSKPEVFSFDPRLWKS